jgi:hypothetical protein
MLDYAQLQDEKNRLFCVVKHRRSDRIFQNNIRVLIK